MAITLFHCILILAIAIVLTHGIERVAGRIVKSGVLDARFKNQDFVSCWNKTISATQSISLISGIIAVVVVLM